jgi:hypothetical protein
MVDRRAEAMRAARRRGEGPFPAPVMSSRARTLTIAGKDDNEIPLRVIAPAHPAGFICISMFGHGTPQKRADQGRECRSMAVSGTLLQWARADAIGTKLPFTTTVANGRDGEGFRMPARGDLSPRAEGRRPKASQEGTRGGLGDSLPSMGI